MLQEKEIKLFPISEKDTEFVIMLRNKINISDNFFTNPPLYDFEHVAWLKNIDKNDIYLIIEYNNKKIGLINISKVDYLNEKAEFGIVIDENYQGKGIAYKSSKLLINYVFDNLKINKIYLNVFSDNENAIKLYKKLGFEQEAFLREEIFKNGKFKNVIRMALFKSKWINNENNI
jgi:diamine N-acetyltransferase